jgi:hypothetical protein
MTFFVRSSAHRGGDDDCARVHSPISRTKPRRGYKSQVPVPPLAFCSLFALVFLPSSSQGFFCALNKSIVTPFFPPPPVNETNNERHRKTRDEQHPPHPVLCASP